MVTPAAGAVVLVNYEVRWMRTLVYRSIPSNLAKSCETNISTRILPTKDGTGIADLIL
jgi:hypothetical protein